MSQQITPFNAFAWYDNVLPGDNMSRKTAAMMIQEFGERIERDFAQSSGAHFASTEGDHENATLKNGDDWFISEFYGPNSEKFEKMKARIELQHAAVFIELKLHFERLAKSQ
jgi:hypothetical protein